MTPIFADSSNFVALLCERDEWHELAASYREELSHPVITTAFVLVEVGNTLCPKGWRSVFGAFLTGLRDEPNLQVLPPTQELYDAGVDLYLNRPDKEWSLTDCISFVVMGDRAITQALTNDHHFEQAGFEILLK